MSIRHIGIVCWHLEEMMKFYNLLGFKEVIIEKLSGDLADTLIGLEDVQIEIVKLKSLKDDTIIELLEYKHCSNYPIKDKRLYSLGFSHIALNVVNIDGIYKGLKNMGIDFVSPPLLTKDNVKVCFCRDIENNYLELVEECGEES